MDYKNFFLGILILILGLAFFYYNLKKKEMTGMLKAEKIKITFANLGIILVGLYIIFLEILKM